MAGQQNQVIVKADGSMGSPAEAPVPTMDPVVCARVARQRSAQSPWLHDMVGQRMAQRLGLIKTPPVDWLDWDVAQGGWEAHKAVAAQWPKSKAWLQLPVHEDWLRNQAHTAQGDPALSRWQRWTHQHPVHMVSPQPVGLLWANMALHRTPYPQTLMAQWHERLAVGGFLMTSGLGPDALRELRQVYKGLGAPPPGPSFTDMHDWGDMLVSTGFAEPVMDVERWVLTYSGIEPLLAELRTLGCNPHPQRARQTWTPRAWQRWCQRLAQAWPTNEQGQLTLTLEVVFGHAYKAAPKHKVAPETVVSLQAMRQELGRRRADKA